jgi:hypothetical protein
MRIIPPGSSLISPASVASPRVQHAAGNAFGARLGAAGGAPSSPPGGGPLPTGADVLQESVREMRQMLLLQYQLSRGTTSLVSNILKTRHETMKNSIQNIR